MRFEDDFYEKFNGDVRTLNSSELTLYAHYGLRFNRHDKKRVNLTFEEAVLRLEEIFNRRGYLPFLDNFRPGLHEKPEGPFHPPKNPPVFRECMNY